MDQTVLGRRTLAAHKSRPTSLQLQENASPVALLTLIERISGSPAA
jgi:hypothetical protein